MEKIAPDRRFVACSPGFVSVHTYDRDEAVKAAKTMASKLDPGERSYVIGHFFGKTVAEDASMIVLCFEMLNMGGFVEVTAVIGQRTTVRAIEETPLKG